MDFRRTILTGCIKQLGSRMVLMALAASLFSAAPALASFSFNVDQVPLAAGGAGKLAEITFAKQAAAVPIPKAIVENSSASPSIVAGASLAGSDGRALNLISAQSPPAPVEVLPPRSRLAKAYGGSSGGHNLDSATPTRNTSWVAQMCMGALVLVSSTGLLRLARSTRLGR